MSIALFPQAKRLIIKARTLKRTFPPDRSEKFGRRVAEFIEFCYKVSFAEGADFCGVWDPFVGGRGV